MDLAVAVTADHQGVSLAPLAAGSLGHQVMALELPGVKLQAKKAIVRSGKDGLRVELVP